jgi:Cysteine dioxygenase type I.
VPTARQLAGQSSELDRRHICKIQILHIAWSSASQLSESTPRCRSRAASGSPPDRFELTDLGLHAGEIAHRAGSTFDFDASHVHRLRHPEGSGPAVSIHVYSPALWRMGYYDADARGLLRRTSVSYAEETAA